MANKINQQDVIKEEKEDVVVKIKCNENFNPRVLENMKKENSELSTVFVHSISADLRIKQEKELIINDVPNSFDMDESLPIIIKRKLISIKSEEPPVKVIKKEVKVLKPREPSVKVFKFPADIERKLTNKIQPHYTLKPLRMCRLCRQLFPDLKQHIMTHFTKLSFKTYRCRRCQKVLYSNNYLDYHTCIIECGLCDQSFLNAELLKIHKETHVKDHQCNKCTQKFHTKKEKEEHEKQHRIASNLICPLCDRRFSSVQSLNRHKLTYAENMRGMFKCDLCDYTTNFITRLKKHKELHEKADVNSS